MSEAKERAHEELALSSRELLIGRFAGFMRLSWEEPLRAA